MSYPRPVLGNALVDLAIGAGANAILPGSGTVVAPALGIFSSIFGGASAEDQRRIQRVQYFYNLAAAGNVGAAQVMIGAIPDVSGNEQPYWQHALQQLQTTNAAVYNAAQMAGPVRFTGTGDTPENYPHMQAYAQNWARSNAPLSPAAVSGGGLSSTPGTQVTPGGYVLPAMQSTAPFNYAPYLIAGVAGLGLLVFASSRSRRR